MGGLPPDAVINQYINQVQEKRLIRPHNCPICKGIGRLRWHGHYERSLITFQTTYRLSIHRLFCVLCRHTFALLPAFITKWHRYARNVIQVAIRWLKSKTFDVVADELTQRCGRCVANLTIFFWKKKFS